MRKLGLAELLPALVAGCVAACGGATKGDPGDSPAPAIETPGEPRALVCGESGAVALTNGLMPTLTPDFIGLYIVGTSGGQRHEPVLVESQGELCSGAEDRVACENDSQLLDPERPPLRPNHWGDSYVFIYSKGDEVGIVYDADDLRAFLGPIDTPNEAAVILWSTGFPLACGSINEDDSGYHARDTWEVNDCPFTDQELILHVAPDGTISQTAVGEPVVTSNSCAGRRPASLLAKAPSRHETPLGRHFADIAHLEAAAVVAFAILERELAEHGAPDELLVAARQALGDEMRHAEIMERLARRFGARPAPVELAKRGKRTLLEIAIENAVEGCVRETYGALVAHYRAATAEDAEIRNAWAAIAPEETEHAELSHALHRWLCSRLSDDERGLVHAALETALLTLRRESALEPEPELVARAGVADAKAATRLLDGLEQELRRRLFDRDAA
jgi:hypothetical protein